MAPAEAGFYQSFGNEATCDVQGFMIQLGQTSMFYNLLLSVYFCLVIVFNWKEHQFKKYLFYTHVLVIILGVGMAIGQIPYSGPQFGLCRLSQPPITRTKLPMTLFFTIPLSIVLAVITVVTVIICYTVSRQEQKALRWSFKRNEDLSRRVFWQSLWYVMAFYVTLPVSFLARFIDFKTMNYYWIFVVNGTLLPAQGFLNSLVYFHRSNKGIGCCRTAKGRGRKQGSKSKASSELAVRGDVSESRFTTLTASKTAGDASGEAFPCPDSSESRTGSIVILSSPDHAGGMATNDLSSENFRKVPYHPQDQPEALMNTVVDHRRVSGIVQHWQMNEESLDDDDDFDSERDVQEVQSVQIPEAVRPGMLKRLSSAAKLLRESVRQISTESNQHQTSDTTTPAPPDSDGKEEGEHVP